MNLNGIIDFKVEPVNHISSMEPIESYFHASIIKDDIEGEGIGETEEEAIISALDDIESIKLGKYESIESYCPF